MSEEQVWNFLFHQWNFQNFNWKNSEKHSAKKRKPPDSSVKWGWLLTWMQKYRWMRDVTSQIEVNQQRQTRWRMKENYVKHWWTCIQIMNHTKITSTDAHDDPNAATTE